MISKIELQIVPDESLPESTLSAFVERARSLGITAEELMVRLIRREIAPPGDLDHQTPHLETVFPEGSN
jgi:hypothetical protein